MAYFLDKKKTSVNAAVYNTYNIYHFVNVYAKYYLIKFRILVVHLIRLNRINLFVFKLIEYNCKNKMYDSKD